MTVLPVVGQPAPERADAARNRRKILAAAQRMIAEGGVDRVTMNEVAAVAGVGVGTIYRRFGDLPGLVAAVMNEHEVQLQQGFIAGPPPLGPGAPPLERIRAFLHAYADLLDSYAELMLVAEDNASSRRYLDGAYAVHHTHLATLLEEANPDLDTHYLADALLAPLSAALFVHHRHRRGMPMDRVKSGLDTLLAGITG